MRSSCTRLTHVLLIAGLGAVASAPVAAMTCYMVLDRNDNVVYRDTYPPVDLSDPKSNDLLRARREHMIAMEADRCLPVQFFMGAAGSTTLSVDEVVNGIPVARANPTASGASATLSARSALPGPSQRPGP